jgi:hypothetical protein
MLVIYIAKIHAASFADAEDVLNHEFKLVGSNIARWREVTLS